MIDKELFNEGIKTVESELNDVKYVRELKQAEDVGDWDKVVSLSDAIQDSGHNIGKAADKINVAIKRGMHIG
ncbi:hypothetical protein [Lactobacillus gallinarum]|uniref:hypothetical protein n=1 Tax=Lactobacillus gallinarum TaxID=52242 RepID=UPI0024B11649|nr:hypothetical protein [Lactobacillus gallinarum]